MENGLKSDSIIFLCNFGENYGFVVQDEVQSFHWRNLQATLHPVVIYYKENEKLKHFSYCVISDDIEHDVAMVYQVQNEVLKKVLADLPETKDVTYFSDGCESQYKSRKHLFNLCQHSSEFGINAKWVFFGTSHGKQPCDGIRGTVKRLTRLVSLGRAARPGYMSNS